ncbi:MAG: TatD family hydrolase [Planctomycetota bacterium]|nr:TatD family hydrolase [Planctomycetota bacterium]
MATERSKLTDAHLHLQDESFSRDIEEVLARAAEAGVERMICCGTCEGDWPGVLELANRRGRIIPCFGLHPWYIGERSVRWLVELRRYLKMVPAGVGEIGLDRYRKDLDEGAQEEIFRAQLALARELDRPVTIHCLRAWDWLVRVLRSEAMPGAGFVLHAFGGPPEIVPVLADLGAYFSFAGDVLDGKRRRKLEALAVVPPDRLLLETDAPDFLPPERFRVVRPADGPGGRPRNEPANLRGIFHGVAELMGIDGEELAGRLSENACRLWRGLMS